MLEFFKKRYRKENISIYVFVLLVTISIVINIVSIVSTYNIMSACCLLLNIFTIWFVGRSIEHKFWILYTPYFISYVKVDHYYDWTLKNKIKDWISEDKLSEKVYKDNNLKILFKNKDDFIRMKLTTEL